MAATFLAMCVLLSATEHWSINSKLVEVISGMVLLTLSLVYLSRTIRIGSSRAIALAAITFAMGTLSLMIWRNRAGDAPINVILAALIPFALILLTTWAWFVSGSLFARFPECFTRAHATRRLALPRDVRALRSIQPALTGFGYIVLTILGSLALAPFLQLGAIVVSRSTFMPGAYRHFRRVREVLALRAQEVRQSDTRPPVLLLRSFADDDLLVQRTKTYLIRPTQTKRSLEELIVSELWEIGPVVTIGNPSVPNDPIGAAHERIQGPLWQPRVFTLIQESSVIAVVLGQTQGLFWEYEQLALRDISVLAVLPPSSAQTLSERWRSFADIYVPARGVVFDSAAGFPLLVWFAAGQEPLVVSGAKRDERDFELAFALWRQTRSAFGQSGGCP